MAERCPDCGLVQKSPPPYASGCYCDYHCNGGKLCDERADYRRRIASLEAAVAAADQMRKFLPVTKTAPLAQWAERYDAAKAELERVKGG